MPGPRGAQPLPPPRSPSPPAQPAQHLGPASRHRPSGARNTPAQPAAHLRSGFRRPCCLPQRRPSRPAPHPALGPPGARRETESARRAPRPPRWALTGVPATAQHLLLLLRLLRAVGSSGHAKASFATSVSELRARRSRWAGLSLHISQRCSGWPVQSLGLRSC